MAAAAEPKIILITSKSDTTADLLVLAAEDAGVDCVRLNTEDLPTLRISCRPGADDARYELIDHRIVIRAGDGICYRRPCAPSASSSGAIDAWASEQWHEMVFGMEAIAGIRWLSRPSRIAYAENKLVQLALARSSGFSIPSTLVTNDAHAVQAFREEHSRTLVKSLGTPLIGEGDTSQFVFAQELPERLDPAELALAPCIFQDLLVADRHLRLTVVSDVVFAAHIHSTLLDWRSGTEPPDITKVSIPPHIAASAILLVSRLGLAFSSMDVVESRGTFFFLDLNPNGEWAWIEKATGYPIAASIVDFFGSDVRQVECT